MVFFIFEMKKKMYLSISFLFLFFRFNSIYIWLLTVSVFSKYESRLCSQSGYHSFNCSDLSWCSHFSPIRRVSFYCIQETTAHFLSSIINRFFATHYFIRFFFWLSFISVTLEKRGILLCIWIILVVFIWRLCLWFQFKIRQCHWKYIHFVSIRYIIFLSLSHSLAHLLFNRNNSWIYAIVHVEIEKNRHFNVQCRVSECNADTHENLLCHEKKLSLWNAAHLTQKPANNLII